MESRESRGSRESEKGPGRIREQIKFLIPYDFVFLLYRGFFPVWGHDNDWVSLNMHVTLYNKHISYE